MDAKWNADDEAWAKWLQGRMTKHDLTDFTLAAGIWSVGGKIRPESLARYRKKVRPHGATKIMIESYFKKLERGK